MQCPKRRNICVRLTSRRLISLALARGALKGGVKSAYAWRRMHVSLWVARSGIEPALKGAPVRACVETHSSLSAVLCHPLTTTNNTHLHAAL